MTAVMDIAATLAVPVAASPWLAAFSRRRRPIGLLATVAAVAFTIYVVWL